MGNLAKASQAYKAIFTDSNPTAPFVEFYRQVELEQPTTEQLEGMSLRVSDVVRAVQRARAFPIHERGYKTGPYFRGSGVIVAGNRDGLAAVDYRHASWWSHDAEELVDPVASRYGAYQYRAYLKLGEAALALRVRETGSSPVDTYWLVDDTLKGNGLLENPAVPHSSGYAYSHTGSVAAASGMLPSASTAAAIREEFLYTLQRDIRDGRIEWWGDEFVGYHNLLAATLSLGGEPAACRQFLTASGVNLH